MAQKAAKTLAARNTAILNRARLITLLLNTAYILLRFLLYRRTATRASYLLYILLSTPAALVQFWLDRVGRPEISNGEVIRRPGEDMEAKGLTEFLWDVVHWTWVCVAVAAVGGDRAWWLWGVVPLYSVWLAWTTYGGMRESLGGMMGKGEEGGGDSKRQKKMEKRGEKGRYR